MSARDHIDRALFARHHAGDRRARDELVTRFLPLAHSIARRYQRPGEPLDDLIQVASVALCTAVDRFDARRGHAFTSYAVPTIAGALKRHFRDCDWAVRPSRSLLELTLRIADAEARLAQQLDRPPTVAELVSETGSAEELVLEALQARRGRRAASLQASVGDDAGERQTLQDTLGHEDDGYRAVEDRAALESLLAYLSPHERAVLRLYFGQGLTQHEVGALLGISQMQVSRMVRRATARARNIGEQQRAGHAATSLPARV